MRNLEDITASSEGMAKANQMTHEDNMTDLERRISAFLTTSRSRIENSSMEARRSGSILSTGTHSHHQASVTSTSTGKAYFTCLESPGISVLFKENQVCVNYAHREHKTSRIKFKDMNSIFCLI